MENLTVSQIAETTLDFSDDEAPDLWYLKALELAICALSKNPAATQALLARLCEAYEMCDEKK